MQALVISIAAMAAAAGAARPVDAKPSRPNILVAIADDWSYPHAGAYGCRWVATPAFDRVAREGVLFTHAYTPNAKCAPSRACLLTGRNSWQLEAACNHVCFFPTKFKTYAEALGEQGYFVGMTAKGWAPGVANDEQGQPRAMAGQPFNARRAKPPAKGINPADYAANFDDFLAAAPGDQPWCFWYGGTEPHRDYEYGSGVNKGKKATDQIDTIPGYWPDNDVVRNDLLDYAFEVEHFDRHLGRMIASLEKNGQLDNTLIVVTADNGMPFPRAKGQQYELSSHMPLAIMWRQGIASPGRTVDDYVSFIDLAPTFVEVAGLGWDATGMEPTSGHSLADIFAASTGGRVSPRRDHVLVGQERHDVGRPHDWGYPIRGIYKSDVVYLENFETDRWPVGNPETGYLNTDGSPTKTEVLNSRRQQGEMKYWQPCFGKRPSEELYDLKADPFCTRNLAQDPAQQALKTALREQLVAELKAQADPRMFGQGEVFEKYPYAEEATRGFYERYRRGEPVKAGWVNPGDYEKEPLEAKPRTEPAAQSPQAQAAGPNIIYILADDLGYGDLGCYGQRRIETPHIDRMAAEGIRFTDHYAGAPVCAPSRCSLMTGLHTGHAFIRGNKEVQPMGQWPLPPDTVTVASLLQRAGYRTALIGKWGLGGPGSSGVPWQQGFDHFFGYLCQRHAHNHYPEFLFRNETRLPLENKVDNPRPDGAGVASVKRQYSLDVMAEEALAFVKKNSSRPFFLYLAVTVPHANNEGENDGMEVPDFGPYANSGWPKQQQGHAAMITRLDAQVGRLLAQLEQLAIDDRTLVIFTSDNGPHAEGGNDPQFNASSGPLRGIKRDLYEGGIRVPLIARWPQQIAAGRTSSHPSAFWDFLPTACELAGVAAPPCDGISYAKELVGQRDLQPKHEYLYWEYGSKQAVRAGQWKAVRHSPRGAIELYDLKNDLAETTDVAKLHGRIAEQMTRRIEQAHTDSPLFPLGGSGG